MESGLAAGSDLVTRQTSSAASASNPDEPVARPSPAGGWLPRGNSLCLWAKPASAAGRRPCWPAGKPVDCNASGGNGCAGQDRIVGRSGGTCVVGFGSWAAPKRTAHPGVRNDRTPQTSTRRRSRKSRRRPNRRRQVRARREEDPTEEDYIFTPVESLQYRNGNETKIVRP